MEGICFQLVSYLCQLTIIYFETERVPKCNQCKILVMHVREYWLSSVWTHTGPNSMSLQYKAYATIASKRWWWCIALHSRGFCNRTRPNPAVTIMAAGNNGRRIDDGISRSISYLWSSYHIVYPCTAAARTGGQNTNKNDETTRSSRHMNCFSSDELTDKKLGVDSL